MKTQPCSVSELNQRARQILESNFDNIYVEGEISDLIQHRSGHWYFTLKDDAAQLRAAMFRYSNQRVKFTPQNGDQVVISGKLSIYELRGSYQFITNTMEPAGAGKLQLAFDTLKATLTKEGLFASEQKQPLPQWLSRIAVITSPQGAAFHDIQTTLARRFPAISILLYPVAVQGKDASEQIVRALDHINLLNRDDGDSSNTSNLSIDAILLARGGGSLEDLWSFNEENVARAIYRSALPIVSAVGHETDFTIADFVADARAATPTAGAELLSQDQFSVRQQLANQASQLVRAFTSQLDLARATTAHLRKRLRDPRSRLEQLAQRRDFLESRLRAALQNKRQQSLSRLDLARLSLARYSPNNQLQHAKWRLKPLVEKLMNTQQLNIDNHRKSCAFLAGKLQVVSPLATLERGYAIVSDASGTVLRNGRSVSIGDTVSARLTASTLICKVESVEIAQLPTKQP